MSQKISIIIPVYNSENTIKNALESVLAQTYENLEIIVVDDGSSDDSLSIIKTVAKTDSRIRYYKEDNKGVSSARNLGIKNASGDLIFFLDSDDYLDKEVIETLVNNFDKEVLTTVKIKSISAKEKREWIVSENDIFVFGTLFIRKNCPSFTESVGYCEDILFVTDYMNSLNIKARKTLDVNCFYNYVQNDNSVTNSRENVLKKIKDIELSMTLLDEKTKNKDSENIKNKKISLFEAELQHASKTTIKEALQLFSLEKYTGKTLRLKLFSSLYRKKNLNGLVRYYKFRKLAKKIILKFI